jgi:hypothetical protein
MHLHRSVACLLENPVLLLLLRSPHICQIVSYGLWLWPMMTLLVPGLVTRC